MCNFKLSRKARTFLMRYLHSYAVILLMLLPLRVHAEQIPAEHVHAEQAQTIQLRLTEVFKPVTFVGTVEYVDYQKIYCHFNCLIKTLAVKPGQTVKQGQRLATVVSTEEVGFQPFDILANNDELTVSGVAFKAGDKVKKNENIAILVNKRQFMVKFYLSQKDLLRIGNLDTLHIMPDLIGNSEEVSTNEVFIHDSNQENWGQFLVEAHFHCDRQCQSTIRAGMITQVLFKEDKEKILLVDAKAISSNANAVYTITKKGTLSKQTIKTGRKFGNKLEVLEGLKVDDTVIHNFFEASRLQLSDAKEAKVQSY